LPIARLGVGVLDPERLHGLIGEQVVPVIDFEPPMFFSAPFLSSGSLATTVVGVFAEAGFFALIARSSRLDPDG